MRMKKKRFIAWAVIWTLLFSLLNPGMINVAEADMVLPGEMTLGEVPVGSFVLDYTWRYEFDGMELPPLYWRVVGQNHYDGVDNGIAGDDGTQNHTTLLTEDIVEVGPFNETGGDNIWFGSSLQQWLNADGFYPNLSPRFQQKILPTNVISHSGAQEPETDDVFILSASELGSTEGPDMGNALPYFADLDPDLTIAAFSLFGEASEYWTRSPEGSDEAFYVDEVGEIYSGFVDNSHGIRPAVNLEAETPVIEHPLQPGHFVIAYSGIENFQVQADDYTMTDPDSQPTSYTFTFTTSTDGALTEGDHILITLPPDYDVSDLLEPEDPEDEGGGIREDFIAVIDVKFNGNPLENYALYLHDSHVNDLNFHELAVRLEFGEIPAGAAVSIEIGTLEDPDEKGIWNPDIPGHYTFIAHTTQDPAFKSYDVEITDGTSEEPIPLYTPEDLANMSNDLSGNYYLENNIDLTGYLDEGGTGWNGGAGWEPVGSSEEPFTGTFDGNGHTISGLSIDRPDDYDVGLFGYTGEEAEIKNISLEAVNIKAMDPVGSLVGYNRGTIINAYADGILEGVDSMAMACVGGLVGINFGYVSDSSASVDVTGLLGVGGLVGENYGTIENSYATGSVSVTDGEVYESYHIGGLVGVNGEGGVVSGSYAEGEVIGIYEVGGLAGRNLGDIENSFAMGSVSGEYDVGGLVGDNEATITNCYATGLVEGTEGYTGGLVGYAYGENVSITRSYYDTETTEQSDTGKGEGKSTVQMKDEHENTYTGWDFEETWGINPEDNDGYPFLQWQDFTHDPPENQTETPLIDTEHQNVNTTTVTIEGTAEPHSFIRITGGAEEATGDADTEGDFSIEVTLNENEENILNVTAEAPDKTESDAATVIITHILDATVDPSETDYILSSDEDVDIILTLNGRTLEELQGGTEDLIEVEDYTVDGDTYTILSSYLDNLETGEHILTFYMDGGEDPVTVIEILPGDATVEPETANYILGTGTALEITLTSNGRTLSSISNGTDDLVVEEDYTVDGDTYTILSSFLDGEGIGEHTLYFYMDGGVTPAVALNIDGYTVTFVDHDSSVLDTQLLGHGDDATAPDDPEREGYTFTDWDADFTNVTSNLTVTAQYEVTVELPVDYPATGFYVLSDSGNMFINITSYVEDTDNARAIVTGADPSRVMIVHQDGTAATLAEQAFIDLTSVNFDAFLEKEYEKLLSGHTFVLSIKAAAADTPVSETSGADHGVYTVCGDVTGDGKLTIQDAILVLRHIVGIAYLNDEQIRRIGNGKTLTVKDAITVLRRVVGLEDNSYRLL